jgi:hypothetical protein
MFAIIRLISGLAIFVFVAFTVINVKNRYAAHEDNPFQAPSTSTVTSGVFGGIKELMASRQSGSGNAGGFLSGVSIGGGDSKDTYRGGYLKSRPEAVGKSTTETACDFYPDQCQKSKEDSNHSNP